MECNVALESCPEAIAAAGYVLIHLESSSLPAECSDEWKDQIRNFESLQSAPLGSRVGWSEPAGIMGHSMGGGATHHSASVSEAIAHNIGAAVATNPQIQLGNLQPITNSLVPIMFTTGSRDTTIAPRGVKEAYSMTVLIG